MTHKTQIGTVGYYVVGILIAILAMIPFLWMITTSLKSARRAYEHSDRVDPGQNRRWTAYGEGVFNVSRSCSTIGNSLFISVTYTFITLISASMAAFAFAKAQVSKALICCSRCYLATMMIPTQVTIIPLFVVMNKMVIDQQLCQRHSAVYFPAVCRVPARSANADDPERLSGCSQH